jgi:hypothetical protein
MKNLFRRALLVAFLAVQFPNIHASNLLVDQMQVIDGWNMIHDAEWTHDHMEGSHRYANARMRVTVHVPGDNLDIHSLDVYSNGEPVHDWYLVQLYWLLNMDDYNYGVHNCGWNIKHLDSVLAVDTGESPHAEITVFAPSSTVNSRSDSKSLGLDLGFGMSGPKVGGSYNQTWTYTREDVDYRLGSGTDTQNIFWDPAFNSCDIHSAPPGKLFAKASESAQHYEDIYMALVRVPRGERLFLRAHRGDAHSGYEMEKMHRKDILHDNRIERVNYEVDWLVSCLDGQCAGDVRGYQSQ